MSQQKNRRRIYRVLLSPKFQLKYGAYYATIALTAVGVFNFLSIFFLVSVIQFGSKAAPEITVAEQLVYVLKQNAVSISLGFGLLGIVFASLAIIFTKNIVGPIRVLMRHIDQLKQGHYEYKSRLRKNDELKPLMEALNELSDALHSRHGSSSAHDDVKRNAG